MVAAWSYELFHVVDSIHFGWIPTELALPHLGSTVPILEAQDPVGMDVGVQKPPEEASVDKDLVRDKRQAEFRTGSSVYHLFALPDE